MTRRHQLETSLRALGLSGMLDTLAARLAQAHAGELGHPRVPPGAVRGRGRPP